eukprot:GHVU01026510.1.p1 GENE.GHVU01026510.1~~GHVU01026510.1.p1  ORF type:complete len:818 (+),score=177.38 GHVU01026510.1:746-3199(+)
MDFLPRGDGVVTRRPLELRLVHLSEGSSNAAEGQQQPGTTMTEWGVFDTDRDRRINITDVKKEIERVTDERAGKNKGLVDDPILLSIYSPRCPDLTLIDLPGIARVPLKGSDQTDDIERLTREMAFRYAVDPRTIILAVTPANSDLMTSDALQIARQADPQGARTIGVITKIDLMDRGTDAARMVMGEEYRLRLGYTGVRNRSQADIQAGKSVQDSLKEETEFFQAHAKYRTLPPGLMGTNYLIEKLTKVLFRHIKQYLPDIRREINAKMRAVSHRLDELGEGVPLEVPPRVHLIWTMISDYCEMFNNTIRGKYDKRLQTYFDDPSTQREVAGGALIRTQFNDLLNEYVDKSVTADMSDYDIDNAIRLHEGDALPGFPSPDTFEFLILPYLSNIQIPVFECLDRVSQSLELLSQRIANKVFGRFPELETQTLEMSQCILVRERESTRAILENIVAAETGYLFTNDARYLSDHGSMIPSGDKEGKEREGQEQNEAGGANGGGMPGGGKDEGARQRSNMESATQRIGQMTSSVASTVGGLWGGPGGPPQRKTLRYSPAFLREIRGRLDSYFNIVLRNIRDAVPKMIGFFLVRKLQSCLQFELYNELNGAERLDALLGEPPHIVEERRALMQQMKILKNSSTVLQRDPHIAAISLEDLDEHPAVPPPSTATAAAAAAGMAGTGGPALSGGVPGGGGEQRQFRKSEQSLSHSHGQGGSRGASVPTTGREAEGSFGQLQQPGGPGPVGSGSGGGVETAPSTSGSGTSDDASKKALYGKASPSPSTASSGSKGGVQGLFDRGGDKRMQTGHSSQPEAKHPLQL